MLSKWPNHFYISKLEKNVWLGYTARSILYYSFTDIRFHDQVKNAGVIWQWEHVDLNLNFI